MSLQNGVEMAEGVEFYQIYYRDEQKKDLFSFSIPYFNNTLTHFFENSVIKSLVTRAEAKKIAVCSWKLREKLRRNIGGKFLTEEMLAQDFDVMSFTSNSRHHKMLEAAEVWHNGFKSLLSSILREIGMSLPKDIKHPIYSNHFCATSQVYKSYVNDCLVPCMDVMDNHPTIRRLCWRDSNYSQLANEPLSEHAQEQLGISYYPMHPFILERLFSVWINDKNLNVKQI